MSIAVDEGGSQQPFGYKFRLRRAFLALQAIRISHSCEQLFAKDFGWGFSTDALMRFRLHLNGREIQKLTKLT